MSLLHGLLSGGVGEWLYHATDVRNLASIVERGGLDPELAVAELDDDVPQALWVSDEPDLLTDYGNLWFRFRAVETDTARNGELLVRQFIPLKHLQVYVGEGAVADNPDEWAWLDLTLKLQGAEWLRKLGVQREKTL